MSGPVFIFGTGGHARDVAEIVHAIGRTPVFVTRDPVERGDWKGADAVVLEKEAVATTGADFAIGIGDGRARARVAHAYPDLRFPALIHPDTSFARNQQAVVETTCGTVVFAGVRLMAGVTVGAFCAFNLNVTVSHDCDVGDFVNLSPGAHIAGNVRICQGAWIGVGAVVNQGTNARKLEIGADTIVGSGAVVLKDCAPQSVYVGNPARKIR
jgi:sugar O-acyltransferase (sialic acid O-acetyltransferase NeuD family)